MLKNKLALITGANRGIGLSILKKFSENGADIIACARSKNDEFEKLIFDISQKYKNKITPVYFDLSREKEIKDGIEKINTISDKIEWLAFSDSLSIDMGILLDPISIMMLVVISTVSLPFSSIVSYLQIISECKLILFASIACSISEIFIKYPFGLVFLVFFSTDWDK